MCQSGGQKDREMNVLQTMVAARIFVRTQQTPCSDSYWPLLYPDDGGCYRLLRRLLDTGIIGQRRRIAHGLSPFHGPVRSFLLRDAMHARY